MKLAIIGLGVMGRNLALNFRDAGHQCVVWDPWPEARNWQVDGIEVCDTLETLVNSLPVPSIVLLMVKSGRPVYELTEQLNGLLEAGDIIIDGGNSNYMDTEANVMAVPRARHPLCRPWCLRRCRRCAQRPVHDVGVCR